MYATYTGTKKGLASDDIVGIRSLYSANGARADDVYDSGRPTATLGTAASITSLINTSTLTALVPNLDITTAGQTDYSHVHGARRVPASTLEPRRAEQRPEPAVAQADGLRLERLDGAGHAPAGRASTGRR